MASYRKDYFYCGIDKNGNIVEVDNKSNIIGIDNQYADELRAEIDILKSELLKFRTTVEEWRPYMQKHGYVEPDPKTPEEMIAEQNDVINKQNEIISKLANNSSQQGLLLAKLLEQIDDLKHTVGEVNNNGNGQSAESGEYNVIGEKPSGNSVKMGRKAVGSKSAAARTEGISDESGNIGNGQQAQADE